MDREPSLLPVLTPGIANLLALALAPLDLRPELNLVLRLHLRVQTLPQSSLLEGHSSGYLRLLREFSSCKQRLWALVMWGVQEKQGEGLRVCAIGCNLTCMACNETL